MKLVAIDMDDTLLRTDKSFNRERFTQIYEEFQKREMILTIASGNSYPKLNEYFSYMQHENLYLAADNGNYLVKDGEVLYKNKIRHSDLTQAVNYLEELGTFSIVFSDGQRTYSKWINPENEDYVLSFNKNLTLIDSLDEIKDKEIVKVAVHSDLSLAESKNISDNLIINFENLDAVTSGGGWLDFYRLGGGKGSAIASLQEKYTIHKNQTMVFGDSLNDASMVQYAKYSIAMGNSDLALKEISNYKIGTNQEQAVLTLLEKYLKNNNLDFMRRYKTK